MGHLSRFSTRLVFLAFFLAVLATVQAQDRRPMGLKSVNFNKIFPAANYLSGNNTDCRNAVNTTCPVCIPTRTNWRINKTECDTCLQTNIDALIEGNCTYLKCQKAVGTTCPGCTIFDRNSTCTRCLVKPLANVTDPKCLECFQKANTCAVCIDTNAQALIDEGCQGLKCRAAVSQICPACPSDATRTGQCIKCIESGGQDTSACDTCRSKSKDCGGCIYNNTAALVAAGCDSLKCLNFTKTACSACTTTAANAAECTTTCKGGLTSKGCVACFTTLTSCAKCMRGQRGKFPKGCSGIPPSFVLPRPSRGRH